MTRYLSALILVLLACHHARADRPLSNYSYKLSSRNGRYHLESVPWCSSGELGVTVVKNTETGEELYRIDRHLQEAHATFLSDDGRYIVQASCRGWDMDCFALRFYRDGELTREYAIREMVTDRNTLRHSVSYCYWRLGHKWWDWSDPLLKPYAHNRIFVHGDVFRVITVENELHSYDARTGARLARFDVPRAVRWYAEHYESIPEAVETERIPPFDKWPAPSVAFPRLAGGADLDEELLATVDRLSLEQLERREKPNLPLDRCIFFGAVVNALLDREGRLHSVSVNVQSGGYDIGGTEREVRTDHKTLVALLEPWAETLRCEPDNIPAGVAQYRVAAHVGLKDLWRYKHVERRRSRRLLMLTVALTVIFATSGLLFWASRYKGWKTESQAPVMKYAAAWLWVVPLLIPPAFLIRNAVTMRTTGHRRHAITVLEKLGDLESTANRVVDLSWPWQLLGGSFAARTDGVSHAEFGRTTTDDSTLALIGTLHGLVCLGLQDTRITDAGLAHLSGMHRLEILDLEKTNVSGHGLSSMGPLPNLRQLDLTGTRVTDDDLEHLLKLPALDALVLDKTAITDAGLARLAPLTSLAELSLRRTKITGAGLRRLPRLTRITHLYLDGTAIQDAHLADIASLGTLIVLHLADTEVTDAGLVELHRLSALQHLDVRGTGVTEKGIEELERALPAVEVVR